MIKIIPYIQMKKEKYEQKKVRTVRKIEYKQQDLFLTI